MIAIPVEDLQGRDTLNVNLHLRLSDHKHVLWLKADSPFNAEMLGKLESKGVTSLYVTDEDYRTYVSSNISLATSLMDSRRTSAGEKISALQQASAAVLREIESFGFNREIFIHAKLSTEVVMAMAEAHPEFISFADQMVANGANYINHALSVSVLSAMIGLQLGWSHPQVLEKLTLGGLLHDVGLLKLPKGIQDKPLSKMTRDERSAYDYHVELGREMLRGNSFIPEDVVAIAYQHHEQANGMGYPQKLTDTQINPLARVVALANEFCELAFPNQQQPTPLGVDEALMRIARNQAQAFNREALQALEQLVQGRKGRKVA